MIVRKREEAMVMLPPVAPAPEREPMVSFAVTLRTTPAVLARMTAELSAIEDPPVSSRVPALMVVDPE